MGYFLASFFTGVLFALGLGLSGMTNPKNVTLFLDIFGSWNPSLIFVMIGAILVHAISYRLILKRRSPVFSTEFQIPKRRDIDHNLIIGALLFGLGWGLAGFCPAPALTALVTLRAEVFTFVICMFLGMTAFLFWNQRMKVKK